MNGIFARISGRTAIAVYIALFVLLSIASVLALRGTSLSRSIASCEAAGSVKQKCFADLISTIGEVQGIVPAFDALARIYALDQEFANFCHGNTHDLGKIAYESYKYSGDFDPSTKMSYCGFGFYHGFLEAMLYDEGDLKDAERFCDWLDAKMSKDVRGVSFACYHGIGHGVTDGSDPALWGDSRAFIRPGLALCAALTDVGENRERCASGVFNALAVAYLDPTYGLQSDPRDPYAICRLQGAAYEKAACYNQMNTFVVSAYPDFGEALEVAATMSEAEYQVSAVTGIAGPVAQYALAANADLAEKVRECNVLRGWLADVCAHGFGSGLIEFGKPKEEYDAAIKACAGSGARAVACFNGVARSVVDRMPPETHARLCENIAALTTEQMAADCRAIVGGKKALTY